MVAPMDASELQTRNLGKKNTQLGTKYLFFSLKIKKDFLLDPTSLAPHERLTDLAVVPREKPHTGAAAREQPRDSDRKSTRLNSSHTRPSRMPSSA